MTVVTLPVSRVGLASGAIFFVNFAAYTFIGPLLLAASRRAPAHHRSAAVCPGNNVKSAVRGDTEAAA